MAQTPEEVKVVMEVDSESLKPYFDNIAEGFSDISQALQKQKIVNAALGISLVISNVVHFII